ncbi:MAG: Cof-type HAD-IIB family hydrolase [Mycoplasma sp.]
MTNTKQTNKFYNFKKIDKKLICVDLDGTLLNSKGEITQKTVDGIKKISNKDHVVCLVTGRPLRGSIDIYNQLGLKTIMVNQNGSLLTNPCDPHFKPIEIGFSNLILKEIISNKVLQQYINNAMIEGLDKIWLWKSGDREENWFEKMKDIFHISNEDIEIINEDFKSVTTDISSILLQVDNLDNLNSIIYEIKNISPTLIVRTWSLFHSDGIIIEINSEFASKKMALKYLCSYYGIPKEQCIAFGDGDNDVGMLETAAWSFALKNASPAPILVARYLTKHTNDDDGVVRELFRLLQLKD